MKLWKCSLLLLIQKVEARLHGRNLRAPNRWEECLGMSGEECRQYILDSLGGDLDNHPIPGLILKIHAQRSPELLKQSYWMFGVRTNIFGEVDCDLHGGRSVFPFVWQGSDGNSYSIPPVECAGKNALECCDAVEEMMVTKGIPLKSSDGKCFSCWVSQQPLKPVYNADVQYVDYEEYSWDSGSQTCIKSTYSTEQVIKNDQATVSVLIGIRAAIKAIMEDPDGFVACGDIIKVRRDVLFYGRGFPRAMTKVSGLLCGQCESGDPAEQITLTIEQHEDLARIRWELANALEADVNYIIIYTDPTGQKVVKVPQIGGSLNDALYPEPGGVVDPDGDEVSGCEAPTQPNGIGGCMCPAIEEISGNQIYWIGGAIRDTAGTGYCECPPHLIEYNNHCFCPGGYKIWDPVLLTCVCPHGTMQDGSCVCPGPFSGLDWNNVGWIKDHAGDSCRIDSECIQSNYDYYSTFEEGCNKCKFGYKDDGQGNCILK